MDFGGYSPDLTRRSLHYQQTHSFRSVALDSSAATFVQERTLATLSDAACPRLYLFPFSVVLSTLANQKCVACFGFLQGQWFTGAGGWWICRFEVAPRES